MISKPKLDRTKWKRDDEVRRYSRDCFDALVAQLGEGEALGQPVRVGDHIMVPVTRARGAAGAVHREAREANAGGGSLRLGVDDAAASPSPRRPERTS